MDAESPDITPIVGVGASAGGLQAFQELLENLPTDTGFAYVLVSHLDPSRPSILSEILARHARMPVVEVTSSPVKPEPNHVYVLAPQTMLSVDGGLLVVTPSDLEHGHRPGCIDTFLESLAASHQEHAIGVILSGTASDGSRGVRAVKAMGGINFAQDDTAQFPDMPRHAISTGAVDFVLSPAGIAEELARISRHPFLSRPDRPGTARAPDQQEGERAILRLLAGATGVDFTQYKQTTIRRRLARRMALRRVEDLGAYQKILEDNPAEVRALHDDILIHVTSFFREPEAFALLESHVLPTLLKDRASAEPLRIWVPGCSTGEEVYSLAIVILEYFQRHRCSFPTQLFGTDVSEPMVDHARLGQFTPAQVTEVSPARLRRFFTRTSTGSYQVSKAVRDLCVFARQDLTRDPPFSRLDLVSCRNLLIYLGQSLQRRVVPLFHYALKPAGFLLLGASESVGGFTHLFTQVEKTNRIYRKVVSNVPVTIGATLPEVARRLPTGFGPEEVQPAFDPGREADRYLLAHYVPATIVVDQTGHIVHIRGETGPFLRPAPGKPSLHLLKMVREDLLLDLDRALSTARAHGATVRREHLTVRGDDQVRDVTLEVVPLTLPGGPPGLCIVLFWATGPQAPPRPAEEAADDGDHDKMRLRDELAASRRYQQALVEKFEATTEELRSTHEEVLSANEELQSTNEELETAKEELQATNEELTTVNDELRHRNVELDQLNGDLENLFASVNLPIALVDAGLRLRRFTPPAQRLFNVVPSDISRRITDFKHVFQDIDLEASLLAVLDNLVTFDREIQDREGHWYACRIRPYRSLDSRVDGAVIVLTDIHALKTSLLGTQRGNQFLESVFDTVPDPILVLDAELRVRNINRAYFALFGTSRDETLGQPFFTLGGRMWEVPGLRPLLEDIQAKDARLDEHPVTVSDLRLRLSARRVEADGASATLLVVHDETRRRRAEEDLVRSEERLSALFNQAFAGIAQCDTQGRVLVANARFGEILARPVPDLLGRRIFELMIEADAARDEPAFAEILAKGGGVVTEERMVRGDGSPVWVSSDLSVVHNDAGQPEYTLLIIQEITARKEAERELDELAASLERKVKERTQELEEVVGELNDFSYTVSHDLRAPLRSMQAMSQLLLAECGGSLDAKGADYIRRIINAASRMDNLVVSLLEYGRLGRASLEVEPLDLDAVVAEVLTHLAADVSRLGAEIDVERPLPAVRANRLFLLQALENLVANALKFVTAGTTPKVRIRTEPRGERLRIWVEDNGIGIAPAYQERIFGVFERLHGSDDFPGTGIGLAIVRRGVERMGGRVGVESEPGQGSRFWIDLPAPAAS